MIISCHSEEQITFPRHVYTWFDLQSLNLLLLRLTILYFGHNYKAVNPKTKILLWISCLVPLCKYIEIVILN